MKSRELAVGETAAPLRVFSENRKRVFLTPAGLFFLTFSLYLILKASEASLGASVALLHSYLLFLWKSLISPHVFLIKWSCLWSLLHLCGSERKKQKCLADAFPSCAVKQKRLIPGMLLVLIFKDI